MNDRERDYRSHQLVDIARFVYQRFGHKLTEAETDRFLATGTFCPSLEAPIKREGKKRGDRLQ
jgi:hypothetical protein